MIITGPWISEKSRFEGDILQEQREIAWKLQRGTYVRMWTCSHGKHRHICEVTDGNCLSFITYTDVYMYKGWIYFAGHVCRAYGHIHPTWYYKIFLIFHCHKRSGMGGKVEISSTGILPSRELHWNTFLFCDSRHASHSTIRWAPTLYSLWISIVTDCNCKATASFANYVSMISSGERREWRSGSELI